MIVLFLLLIHSSNLIAADRSAVCASRPAFVCRGRLQRLTAKQCEAGYRLSCNVDLKRKTPETGEWIFAEPRHDATLYKQAVDNVTCIIRNNEHLRVFCEKNEDCETLSVKEVLSFCNVTDSTILPFGTSEEACSKHNISAVCDGMEFQISKKDCRSSHRYIYCGRNVTKENGTWTLRRHIQPYVHQGLARSCRHLDDTEATAVCFGDNCDRDMTLSDILRICKIEEHAEKKDTAIIRTPLPPIDTCPSVRRPPTKCDEIAYPGVYQDSYLYCGRTIEKNESGDWSISKSDSSFAQSLPLTWCQVNAENKATAVCFGDNCSKNWSISEMMTICSIPERKSRAMATNNQQLNNSDSLITLLDETRKEYEERLRRLKRQLDQLEKEIESAQNSFAVDGRMPKETYTNIHLTLNAWRIAVSLMKNDCLTNDYDEILISIPKKYFILLVISTLSLVVAIIFWRRYATRHKRILKRLTKPPPPPRPHGTVHEDSAYEEITYSSDLS